MPHDGREALVVNPGDAQPVVLNAPRQLGVQLEAILVTHHHADHNRGVSVLRRTTIIRAVQAFGASARNEVSIVAALRQQKNLFQ